MGPLHDCKLHANLPWLWDRCMQLVRSHRGCRCHVASAAPPEGAFNMPLLVFHLHLATCSPRVLAAAWHLLDDRPLCRHVPAAAAGAPPDGTNPRAGGTHAPQPLRCGGLSHRVRVLVTCSCMWASWGPSAWLQSVQARRAGQSSCSRRLAPSASHFLGMNPFATLLPFRMPPLLQSARLSWRSTPAMRAS